MSHKYARERVNKGEVHRPTSQWQKDRVREKEAQAENMDPVSVTEQINAQVAIRMDSVIAQDNRPEIPDDKFDWSDEDDQDGQSPGSIHEVSGEFYDARVEVEKTRRKAEWEKSVIAEEKKEAESAPKEALSEKEGADDKDEK